ncbi:MAG TPA: PD-(D/E)XK nuclease family protein [Pirellulaceae bacterium]
MPAEFTVLVGPARSGKTYRLVRQYRDALESRPAGSVTQAIWLAPSSRSVAAIRQQLLGAGATALLEPRVLTFDHLADRVLTALPQPPRSLSPFQQRSLIRWIVERAEADKQLIAFAAAARHSSFIDLLVDHFGELVRHGITAATFNKSGGTRGDRAQHTELSQLYSGYETLLKKHQLFDHESRHAVVRDALQSNDYTLFTNLDVVVADGFTDFTCLQHEILAALGQRCRHLVISLPGDDGLANSEQPTIVGRSDLFAKSAATLAELRRHVPRLKVEAMMPRPTDWPALDHLASNLFLPPRRVTVPSPEAIASLDRLEIVAAAGAQDEIVQIARRIKQQLVDRSMRPSDIAVVFRSLHDAAPRVREVFAEYGIPYSLDAKRPLTSTGAVRAIFDLLRLDIEDWPFRNLVSIVTNNLLTVFDRPTRAATEWLIRDLQIAKGREPLTHRVDQLACPPAAISATTESAASHRRTRASAAAITQRMLQQLSASIDELPKHASPTAWIAALERLGTRLGIAAFAETSSESADDSANVRELFEARLAWQQIATHFAAIEALASKLDQPAELTRSGALHLLVDVAAHESLKPSHDDVGRVRILSAIAARNIEARHLFLAGMSEQSFPSPERVGRLYSEADYQCFQNVGDQHRAESPPPAVTRSQEEMLLFYEVLTRARERLTISYPALDEKAQDLPPSSYVTELERLLEPHAKIIRIEPQLSPVSAILEPLSPSEWRVQAVKSALEPAAERNISLFAGLLGDRATKHVAASIDSALRIHSIRAVRDAFGPADGLLTSPAIRGQLARRFGPQHLWSPSQWEKYARCPFHSLLEDVLQLEPLGELTLEIDAARRGSLLHRVLANVHRQLQSADGGNTLSQREPATVAAAFERALEAELGSAQRDGLDGALEELDRRQIIKWSEQYIEHHNAYDSAWRELDRAPLPTYFEFRFGPARSEESDAEDHRSTAEPFLLDIGGEQLRITGRIDRIDVGQVGGQTVFNVIDYKSGRRPTLTTEKMESGERLQPPLYVMAAQVLLFGENNGRPLWAGYWSMDKGMTASAKYSLNCSAEEWSALQQSVVARIRQFVTDIRAGNFPVASRDDQCTSICNFSTVCRVAQVRSLGKQWISDLNPEP